MAHDFACELKKHLIMANLLHLLRLRLLGKLLVPGADKFAAVVGDDLTSQHAVGTQDAQLQHECMAVARL